MKIHTVRLTLNLPRGSSSQTQHTNAVVLLKGADTARERHGSDKERQGLGAHTGTTDDSMFGVHAYRCFVRKGNLPSNAETLNAE